MMSMNKIMSSINKQEKKVKSLGVRIGKLSGDEKKMAIEELMEEKSKLKEMLEMESLILFYNGRLMNDEVEKMKKLFG